LFLKDVEERDGAKVFIQLTEPKRTALRGRQLHPVSIVIARPAW
jgi:hypothetical protein